GTRRPDVDTRATGAGSPGARRRRGARGDSGAYRSGGPVRPADRVLCGRFGGGIMSAVLEAPAIRTGHDGVPLTRLFAAELRWIFRRPRTLAVLSLLALIPVVVGIGLTLVGENGGADVGPGDPAGPALLASAVNNAFILPIATLVMTSAVLLPLASAMAGADAIAGEASHGTLRGWLIAPVGRGRLLAVKAFGVATVSVVAVLAICF